MFDGLALEWKISSMKELQKLAGLGKVNVYEKATVLRDKCSGVGQTRPPPHQMYLGRKMHI